MASMVAHCYDRTVDFETQQALFHAFDPQQPLRRDTAGLYVARGGGVTEDLLRQLRFAGEHRFLLAGAVGSGKSTELFQAHRRMEDDEHYATLLVDLLAQFDVRTLTAGQVVFLVSVAILQVAQLPDEEAKPLRDELARVYLGILEDDTPPSIDLSGLLSGLGTVVAGLAGEPAGAAAARTAGAAAGAAASTLSLPGRGRELPPHDPRARALSGVLQKVVNAARRQTGKRFLVLVDGLDKVRDEQHIQELFCSGVLSCPGVAGLDLVFAAPPSLRYQVGYGSGVGFEMLRLGLFAVVGHDGERNEAECRAMRGVVDKRIKHAGLDPERVLPPGEDGRAAVERAIDASGGLVRDLMHVVRRAVVDTSEDPSTPLQPADLDGGIRKRAREYMDLLDLDRERLLHETLQTGQRPGGDEVDHLMNDNLILTYDNERPWCRPHPMVIPMLRERFGEV